MRIFMTGGDGYLGRHLQTLRVEKLRCNVREMSEVRSEVLSLRPDIILHLASKTNVDYCENAKHEDEVVQTNVRGTFNIAAAAEEINCGVILLSTDHVFSGKKWFNFKYKETSAPDPVNFYGMSKLSAESLRTVFPNLKVVRSSYVYDRERLIQSYAGQTSFPTFLKRSFIHKNHFGELIMRYASRFWDLPALIHLCGSDSVSWADFMQDVFHASGSNIPIYRRNEEIESLGLARRGHNLGLDNSLSLDWGFPKYSYKDGLQYL